MSIIRHCYNLLFFNHLTPCDRFLHVPQTYPFLWWLRRPAAAPPSWFIVQPRQPFLHKPLYPLVGMVPAQAHGRRNGGDRYPVRQEENNPGTSEQPSTDGGRPLPREERLAFRRREGDLERGCASTSHTAPFCETWGDGHTMGFQAFSGDQVREGTPRRQHRWSPDTRRS